MHRKSQISILVTGPATSIHHKFQVSGSGPRAVVVEMTVPIDHMVDIGNSSSCGKPPVGDCVGSLLPCIPSSEISSSFLLLSLVILYVALYRIPPL